MVQLASLTSTIERLRQLYDCLTVYQVDFTVGTKIAGMKRETVPFFGHNNVIIGLKYGKQSRGIIRLKGHLPNLIGVDLQCFNKNVNVKISSDNLHLTGSKSEEMGHGIFEILMHHFHMVQANFNSVLRLSPEAKTQIRSWLLLNLADGSGIKPFITCLEYCSQIPPEFDTQAATYLAMFAAEFTSLHDYAEKIDRLLEYTLPIFDEVPNVRSFRICNGVYSYSFGQQISLIKTSQILGQLRNPDGSSKYGVAFHNWSSRKQIRLVVPLDPEQHAHYVDDSDSSSDRVEGKIPAHRFTLFQSGSVKQYSPTSYSVAYTQYEQFISDIKAHIFDEITARM